MLAVATLVFFMIRLVPGDPIASMLADSGSPEAREAMIRRLGLDQPLIVQFWRWFTSMLQGDLGASIYGNNQPVSTILLEALPRTMSLAFLSFMIALIIAVPAGILSAMRKNTATDAAVSIFAFLGLSMPDFWLAILLIIVFSANLQWLPAISYAPHVRRNMGMAQAFDPSVNRHWHWIFCDYRAYDPVLYAGSNAGGLYADCCLQGSAHPYPDASTCLPERTYTSRYSNRHRVCPAYFRRSRS